METATAVQRIIEEIRHLATVNPVATYCMGESKVCKYTSGSVAGLKEEGCIVGQAILTAFPDLRPSVEALDNLRDLSGFSAMVLMEKLGLCSSHPLPGTQEYKEVEWISMVQRWQDDGQPWGECVTSADKNYPLE